MGKRAYVIIQMPMFQKGHLIGPGLDQLITSILQAAEPLESEGMVSIYVPSGTGGEQVAIVVAKLLGVNTEVDRPWCFAAILETEIGTETYCLEGQPEQVLELILDSIADTVVVVTFQGMAMNLHRYIGRHFADTDFPGIFPQPVPGRGMLVLVDPQERTAEAHLIGVTPLIEDVEEMEV